MINPFDVIIERLDGLESKIAISTTVQPALSAEIISRDELCKRLSITEPTAIRWEKRGKLPCFRIGSSVRYNWNTVINALEKKGNNK